MTIFQILPTVPPKPLISINSAQNTSGPSSTNNHFNNQNLNNKDLMDIPIHRTLGNHLQIHTQIPVETKETFQSIKHLKDNSKVKETSIITSEKEQIKSDKNIKKVTLKTRKKVDISNNASVFPIK